MFNWICENWHSFIIVGILVIYFLLMGILIYDGRNNPDPERIEQIAEGRLICMRYMGSWYNQTELKFDNGSMTVVPYWFSRNLRKGTKYKIWWSSKTGWHYEVTK